MKHALILTLTFVLCACSDPKDIVLGPDPLKQMADQGDQFKKLSEDDRQLLVSYVALTEMGKVLGSEIKPVTGKTVAEALTDARAWKVKLEAAKAEEEKRDAEQEALRQKVLAERARIAQRISDSAVVAVVGMRVLPQDYEVGRYSEMLSLTYAVDNKSPKAVKQIKGRVTFKDATGDVIGWLPVNIEQTIQPGKTINTDTGRAWKMNQFLNGDIEKIAGREFSSMTSSFEPESIAFGDGEVLKGPDLP